MAMEQKRANSASPFRPHPSARLERDGRRYCYRLTDKGKRVAAMFVLFHQRICGPLANSLFPHRPKVTSKPPAKIEAACRKPDAAIQKLVGLVAA